MKTRKLLLTLLAACLPAQLWAADCYRYEPEKSHIPGTLESRADGSGRDVFVLIADEPLCVEGGENPEQNVPEKDIKELQVLYKDPYRIQVLVGKKVQVDGWLFHKDSDEQITDVLIDARKVKPVVVW
ncbi:MAG: hypothetical protein ACPHER_09175 [Nevskiales bacterium]